MLDLLSSGGLAAKGLGGGTRGFRNVAFCSARRFYGAHVAKVCKPEVGGNRDAPWNKGIVGRNELLNKTCLLFSCFSPFLLISSLSLSLCSFLSFILGKRKRKRNNDRFSNEETGHGEFN